MINYNTEAMHTTAKTIQNNSGELQGDLSGFWSSYQGLLDGALPTLNTCFSGFMNLCKPAMAILVSNRTDLGTKLEQAATLVDKEEAGIRHSFMHRPE